MLVDIILDNNFIYLNKDKKSIILEALKNFFLISSDEIPNEVHFVLGEYVNTIIGTLSTIEDLRDLENLFKGIITTFLDSEFLEYFDIKVEYKDRRLILNVLYKEKEEKALEINLTQLTLELAKLEKKYIEDTYEDIELLGDPLISFIEMLNTIKPGYNLDKRIDGYYYFGDFRLVKLTDEHIYEINAIKNITNGN